MAELAEDALHGVVDGSVIGEVAGERVRLTAVLTNLRDQLIERLPVASDREHGAPRLATAMAAARPMPLDAPVMMTCRPTSGPAGSSRRYRSGSRFLRQYWYSRPA